MTISLSFKVTERLKAEAAARGVSPDVLADQLLDEALSDRAATLAAVRDSLDEAEADYRKNGGVSLEAVRAEISARIGGHGR
jgi:hypothetical protein